MLEPVLSDPRCAKIILTRNPLDSYHLSKIARETKQWQLKNIKRRREAQVEFEAEAFVKYLNRQQEFHCCCRIALAAKRPDPVLHCL